MGHMGWKIVRDNNEEWCRAHGVSGSWRISPDPVRALGRKLFEEAGEFNEALDPDELYDLLDVVSELITLLDASEEAYRAHHEKTRKHGGFSKHLEWSPVPPEHIGKMVR